MRPVLKGKTQEFIQGGITPSGLATQVRRGIIKGFDATTYRATVQLLGSLSVWLEGVPVAKHIGNNLLSSGTRCGVLFFDESNPGDACVAFVYDGAPGPWITSGLVVDGAITAADCLSNVAGGLATIDASGDLNPPNHVRAAGRFYPGGQGTRYMYDAGATSGLAVAGGPFSTTGRLYPGTGAALQTTGYIIADASGNLALMGGSVGVGTTGPGAPLHVAKYGAGEQVRLAVSAGTGFNQTAVGDAVVIAMDTYNVGAYPVKLKSIATQAVAQGWPNNDFAITTNTDGVEYTRFFIRNNGSIGVGTTGPGAPLHVAKYGAGEQVRLAVSAGTGFNQTAVGDAVVIAMDTYNVGAYPVKLKSIATQAVAQGWPNNDFAITTNTDGVEYTRFFIRNNGSVQTYGYIYPGTGSALQTSRYIRDDGDRLLAYGGFKIDVSSGDTPLVFQRAGAYKWTNYVYATYDDLRWGAYISGAWYDRMVLDDGSGNLYIDGTYNTFSPLPPKENMSPEDYLAWALEDASKPPKPYPGIPKDPVELERYRKDISRIAIGVAKYADHLRSKVAGLETRLTQAGF